jgi:hypothetical protein
MPRVRAWQITAFAALEVLGVGASRAEPSVPYVRIEFDLARSVVVAGGAFEIPPNGSIDYGTVILSVPATAQGQILPGPAEIAYLNFSLDTDANWLETSLTGPFEVVQQGTAAGTLNDAKDGVLLSTPLFLDRRGTISCGGPFCRLFASGFPIVFAGIEAIPAPATLQVAGLDDPGRATISDVLAVTMNGGTALFRIQGDETIRVLLLPEPGAAGMAAAAALALGVLERLKHYSNALARGRS